MRACVVGDGCMWRRMYAIFAGHCSVPRRYNSRQSPPVYGYQGGPGSASGEQVKLVLLRAGESLQQVLSFWN
jgi:hypothetical protein